LEERGGDSGQTALSGGSLLTVIQMFARNSHGQTTSPLVLLQLPPAALNISTRLLVGTSENVLIGGFIVTGNAPKIVIVRAIGPSLGTSGLGGALQDPVLELRGGTGALLAENDNWRGGHEAEIKETTIPPSWRCSSRAITLRFCAGPPTPQVSAWWKLTISGQLAWTLARRRN
jgi:hypothetical protein